MIFKVLQRQGYSTMRGGREFMNRVIIFLFRVFLGAFFAVLLTRFFYPDTNPVLVAGLGVFMVLMAYFFEYLRKNRQA